MSRKYTAQEMREAADNFWVGGVICVVKDEDGHVLKHIKHDEVVAMLRHAADAMEQEGKREKKYEYAVKDSDGDVEDFHYDSLEMADEFMNDGDDEVVRREVGEWEEI